MLFMHDIMLKGFVCIKVAKIECLDIMDKIVVYSSYRWNANKEMWWINDCSLIYGALIFS